MPVAGWCVATASSIVLASVAILPVLRTPVGQDNPLSHLPSTQASSLPAPLPSATVGPAPATTRPSPRPTTSPSAEPGRRGSSSPTPSPSRSTAPTSTTEDGWTVTTDADGVRSYVRSFRVAGGQAVIRMTSAGVVELVTATPADGYAVQRVQNSPDNMAVYFNEPHHSFIIHAIWWDDRPFVQVSEVGG
ncbi:DNA mismatch repair protein MutL [Micromonospora radicis]|uniref:DNA mismatch repair protein MutL n=1 Tax=Micromonospora radicis TaxID=1894971 RepID=A0A418MXE1_9ACTN|nr:DNA mismatch repair protein MutL [Micromonospora radicis]RIV39507.1 DNA mismatch repair protein MutL [Micromonospora radicis]